MASTLVSFMEDLVLDPARYRHFTTQSDDVLAASGLTNGQRGAIASGQVSAVTQILDGDANPDYIQGASLEVPPKILFTVPEV